MIELDADVVEIARRHLGLRRSPGLKVRVGDGRAMLAGRPDGSADAVLVDAFLGAQVPRHLVTAEALADLARVAGLAAVNVVDARPFGDAAAIAAGLRGAFRHVLALGAAPVLAKRRGGNIVLAGAHRLPALERLRTRAAADRSPGARPRARGDGRVHRRRAAVARRGVISLPYGMRSISRTSPSVAHWLRPSRASGAMPRTSG